jgi:ADP-heptose:LPS heptosyltransferase/GT2 family glycosyltransferase
MNSSSTFRGLTPAKIQKAVAGIKQEAKAESKPKPIRRKRPQKQVREAQSGDNVCLLSLPFSMNQAAVLYQSRTSFSSSNKPEATVIVPIYNTDASRLIRSWDASDTKIELIFVDDNCPVNSKDQVVKAISDTNLSYRIYASSDKQGWEACCNIGAERALSDTIIFLHPDIILTENWFRAITRMLRSASVGAVGLLQLETDATTFAESGSSWSWQKERFLKFGREIYKFTLLPKPFLINNIPADLTKAGDREVVSSYCMATTKENFRRVGGFCPRISCPEWSSADYCMELRCRGLRVVSQCISHVYLDPDPLNKDRNYEQARMFFRNKWVASGRIDPLVGSPRKTTSKVESIVVRRGAASGDVLAAAAVLPALKKQYPKAKIIFSTDCPEVLANNPNIDKVVELHSERWFDLYLDLDMAYEYKPDLNILEAYAETCGVPLADCQPFIHRDPFDGLPEEYAVIHAGRTMWAGRDWSSAKFDIIAKRLQATDLKVVCVGTETDHRTACDVDLRGKTSVSQLADVIAKAKLFVGIDSFPMHVAQCFDVPGVCFFGSIKPQTRLYSKNIRPVFADGLKCLGCHHRKPTPCTSTVTCDVGIQDCINNVTTDHFWKAIQQTLETCG